MDPVVPSRLDEPRGDSEWAIHVEGSSRTWLGCVLNLDHDVDVSGYSGISFWAKAPNAPQLVLLLVPASGDSVRASVQLTGEGWSYYEVVWPAGDATEIYNLAFDISGTPFDVWIDDVRFVE
jgi:hypothetical protein